jgi:hypothetical protein
MRFLRRGARIEDELPVEADDTADEATADEAAGDAEGEPDAEPEPEAGEQAEAEPAAGTLAEFVPDAEPEFLPRPEPAPDIEPGTEPETEPEPEPEPEPEQEREALPAPDAELDPEPWPDLPTNGRPWPLRIAALHLRAGQHALARAELEALAGHGRLDEAALLDLAEVRWRTGDLAGAGDAAGALLARGRETPLALVIAAESVNAAGRPGEARRLSGRALELVDGPLDPLFAGMPRSAIWPASVAVVAPSPSPRRHGRRPSGEGTGAPSTASEAFAGGRAALARGDAGRAALLLGVAMRLEPGFAEDVLRAVASRDDQPQLALVRGDALRLLGREAEALDAFDRARGHAASAPPRDDPDGPGLFDPDGGLSDDDEA